VRVKTGVLRNHLSRYLRLVREKGESVVVLDRETPVAEILPYRERETPSRAGVWEIRARDEETNGRWSEDFVLPERNTADHKHGNPLD